MKPLSPLTANDVDDLHWRVSPRCVSIAQLLAQVILFLDTACTRMRTRTRTMTLTLVVVILTICVHAIVVCVVLILFKNETRLVEQ